MGPHRNSTAVLKIGIFGVATAMAALMLEGMPGLGLVFFFFFKAGVSLLQLLNVSFKDEYKTATLPSKS